MKKIINLICIMFFSCCLFAQDPSELANRNTALRFLKLSETSLLNEDWENGLKQAELGLSYDDSISDLIYAKATGLIKTGASRAQVIELMELAFSKNNWVGYTVNGARILYADLLSDVGRYSKSMMVLNEDSYIFSADAEFIRIKNFYRMGTEDSLKEARLKLNSSRRIYPEDIRFPKIFFMFEFNFMKESLKSGVNYEIPEIVQTIADSYINKLPDYSGENPDIELLATFFAADDIKIRLLKAIDAKKTNINPLLALAGLKSGLYTELEALNMFFESAGDHLPLGLLESMALNLTNTDGIKFFVEKLLNYSGKLFIDEDFDLQPELIVEYKSGRPDIINYDYNNDGIIDIYGTCDYGAPNFVFFNGEKARIYYSQFPNVKEIQFSEEKIDFNFLNEDFKISVLDFPVNSIFANFGLEFYIPVINRNVNMPKINELVEYASSVVLPVEERENSTVIYKLLNGHVVFADFYENNKKYAYCDFVKGFPISRFVDKDGDDYFETKEIFNISETHEDCITPEEIEFVNKIFNPKAFNSNVYLMKVEIDRNGNTFYEFSQQYLGKSGVITSWDNDDNGIIDNQFIKYPVIDNSPILEDSIFFDGNGNPYLYIHFIDKIPVKMDYNNREVMVYSGNSNNFYWIEKEGTVDEEKFILDTFLSNSENGIKELLQYNNSRIGVIKVNNCIFAQIIPDYSNELSQDHNENENEIENFDLNNFSHNNSSSMENFGTGENSLSLE